MWEEEKKASPVWIVSFCVRREFPKGFSQKSASASAEKHFAVWNRMLGNLLWRITLHLKHPLEDTQEGLW